MYKQSCFIHVSLKLSPVLLLFLMTSARDKERTRETVNVSENITDIEYKQCIIMKFSTS